MHHLTALTVKSKALKPGRHSDGGNLYLNVSKAGTKSWVFLWRVPGTRKNKEMGLGSADAVSLADAREHAAKCRRLVAQGIDPLDQKREIKASKIAEAAPEPERITFEAFAEEYVHKASTGWRNPKHRAQWRSTLKTYVYPVFGSRPIDEIDTDCVLQVLDPIWTTKNETASRIRMRIEAILNAAKVKKLRTGDNPAVWRGHLSVILPARSAVAKVEHHAAMPYDDLPAFYVALKDRSGMGALALRFAILTAARVSEVRFATWREIDHEGAVWSVPSIRMKADRPHRVPLSSEAVALLNHVRPLAANDDAFIFPGLRDGALSESTMKEVLERMGHESFTAHGFRSTFRDWAGEETEFPREVAEAALAHVVGDKAEQAYRRGDALAKRRKLMDAWDAYVTGHPAKRAERAA